MKIISRGAPNEAFALSNYSPTNERHLIRHFFLFLSLKTNRGCFSSLDRGHTHLFERAFLSIPWKRRGLSVVASQTKYPAKLVTCFSPLIPFRYTCVVSIISQSLLSTLCCISLFALLLWPFLPSKLFKLKVSFLRGKLKITSVFDLFWTFKMHSLRTEEKHMDRERV